LRRKIVDVLLWEEHDSCNRKRRRLRGEKIKNKKLD